VARIEKSIEIRAEPSTIWELLFWDRIPEWMDMIQTGEYTSPAKDMVSATAHVVSRVAGITAEWDLEITEYDKWSKAAWRTTGGDLTAIGLTTLTPTNAGTRLTLMMDYELPYSVLGQIIDKLRVRREAEKSIERGLETLQRRLAT
jgi:uncharacterized membrane protein